MMLVKSPEKKEKRTRRSGAETSHSISEGEVGKRIQNQARRVRTKKKKQEQCAQVKRQEEMTQQLIHQQE